MVAELRRVGDRLVALYTDDNEVYRRLAPLRATVYGVPYQQGQRLIGVDLYFPARARRRVKEVLRGQMVLEL